MILAQTSVPYDLDPKAPSLQFFIIMYHLLGAYSVPGFGHFSWYILTTTYDAKTITTILEMRKRDTEKSDLGT